MALCNNLATPSWCCMEPTVEPNTRPRLCSLPECSSSGISLPTLPHKSVSINLDENMASRACGLRVTPSVLHPSAADRFIGQTLAAYYPWHSKAGGICGVQVFNNSRDFLLTFMLLEDSMEEHVEEGRVRACAVTDSSNRFVPQHCSVMLGTKFIFPLRTWYIYI